MELKEETLVVLSTSPFSLKEMERDLFSGERRRSHEDKKRADAEETCVYTLLDHKKRRGGEIRKALNTNTT